MANIKKLRDDLFLISWNWHKSSETSPVKRLGISDYFFKYKCNLACKTITTNYYRDPPILNNSLRMEIIDKKTQKSVYPVEFKTVQATRNGGNLVNMKKSNSSFVHENDPASLIWEVEFRYDSVEFACFQIFIETYSPISEVDLLQKQLKNLKEVVNLLRENQTLSDVVTFKCENQTIKGHLSILTASSPVFAAMFQHEFKEKQEKVVEITDITSNVFEQLVQYIYFQEADFKNVNVVELFVAADKYEIVSLKEECSIHLSKSLTVENVGRCLILADLHKMPTLLEASLDFMAAHSKAICSRDSEWMAMIKNYPELAFQATKRMTSIL